MAIPKTGSRKIVVGGVTYRWLIRRRGTRCQTDYGNGRLHVAVERVETPGATLLLLTDRLHPQDIGGGLPTAVTPSDVAVWIAEAIRLGWKPAASGGPMVFQVEGRVLERRRPRASLFVPIESDWDSHPFLVAFSRREPVFSLLECSNRPRQQERAPERVDRR